ASQGADLEVFAAAQDACAESPDEMAVDAKLVDPICSPIGDIDLALVVDRDPAGTCREIAALLATGRERANVRISRGQPGDVFAEGVKEFVLIAEHADAVVLEIADHDLPVWRDLHVSRLCDIACNIAAQTDLATAGGGADVGVYRIRLGVDSGSEGAQKGS